MTYGMLTIANLARFALAVCAIAGIAEGWSNGCATAGTVN